MYNMMQQFGFGYGSGYAGWSSFFILIMIWSLLWKGLALWHSSQRKQGWWFIVLLVLNTAGILELIYLFAVAKVPTSELFGTKKKGA